tara:strand:- start:10884 stop:11486 length:603 start_codon:yes stop_codon:yes gene_type:complete
VSIFVGNLPFRAEREDVLQLFTPFGEVTNCSLPLERDTGRKRGFAFVEMADESLETTAIDSLQGTEMMGRPLRINKAEPRSNSPRRGFNNGNSRQYNGGGYNSGSNNGGYNNGGYNSGSNNGGYNNGGYNSGSNNGGYNNGGYTSNSNDQVSNTINRSSGARGWEDRSYGNNTDNSEYENGRSRRKRGGSNELDSNQDNL